MNDYPKMLFRQPGNEPMHGGHFATLIVADEAGHEAALADGWHETTTAAKEAYEAEKAAPPAPPAPEPLPVDAAEASAPTRAELEQKAAELGIDFDGRTGDKKLAEKIAAKLAG
jgi:hypothetical protein